MNPSMEKPVKQVMFEAGVSGISFPDATLGVSSLPLPVVEQHFGQSRGCSEFFEVVYFTVLILDGQNMVCNQMYQDSL